MKPKQALEHIIDYGPSSDVGVDPTYWEAIDTLRSLVEQPTVQEVRKEIKRRLDEMVNKNNLYREIGIEAYDERMTTLESLLDFIDRKEA